MLKRFYPLALGLALILPLLVPLGLALKASHDIQTATVYRLPIAGYDPRDMLRGHYLVFQFAWPWAQGVTPDGQTCAAHFENCCVCLNGPADKPLATLGVCTSAKSCPAQIKGRYDGDGRFDIGIDQYYIPESDSYRLEGMLRQNPERLRLGLAVRKSGLRPKIEKLYVGDVPLDVFLRENPAAPAQPE